MVITELALMEGRSWVWPGLFPELTFETTEQHCLPGVAARLVFEGKKADKGRQQEHICAERTTCVKAQHWVWRSDK